MEVLKRRLCSLFPADLSRRAVEGPLWRITCSLFPKLVTSVTCKQTLGADTIDAISSFAEEHGLVPQTSSQRISLPRTMLSLVFCALVALSQAHAFQTQGQVELNEAGRKIKTRVAPEYPELAKRLRVYGVARVKFIVTPEGTVKEVHEVGGNPVLVAALTQAVKQWKYEPSARETVVEVKATFPPPN